MMGPTWRLRARQKGVKRRGLVASVEHDGMPRLTYYSVRESGEMVWLGAALDTD